MKRFLGILLLVSSMIMAGDGTVDSSFGTAGISIQTPSILGIFVQSNGAIIACGGTVTGETTGVPTVTRYSAQGILDTSFGTGGTVSFPSVNGFFNQVLVQPDQKIVALGTDRANTKFIATRLNSNGSLDSSFNGGSLIEITIPTYSVLSQAYVQGALQIDGKILFVGTVGGTNGVSMVTVRITSEGALDATFNSTGFSVVKGIIDAVAQNTIGNSVALQVDNTIMVRGTTYAAPDDQGSPLFVRYNQDGTFDSSFGIAGMVVLTTIIDQGPLFAKGLIIQSDGTMISDFYTINFTTGASTSSLMRLQQDGSFDNSFGTNGVAALPSVSIDDTAPIIFQLLRQDNGSIIALGQVFNVLTGDYQSFITRFTLAGVLDTTFAAPLGYAVLVPSQFSTPPQTGTLFSAGAFQQNGSIIAAGIQQSSPNQGYLQRFGNSHSLVQTTISPNILTGTAQSVSVVELFANGVGACTTLSLNDTWICTASGVTGYTLTAVAHYPGGNIDLPSICQVTLPESALSTAIRAKYCPC